MVKYIIRTLMIVLILLVLVGTIVLIIRNGYFSNASANALSSIGMVVLFILLIASAILAIISMCRYIR